MLHEPSRAINVQFVFSASIAAEGHGSRDVGVEVAMIHGDGDHDFVNPARALRGLGLGGDQEGKDAAMFCVACMGRSIEGAVMGTFP